MNQQQWQMKKDQAASISLAAAHARAGLAGRGDRPDSSELGAATPAVDIDCQTCFDWGATAEQSK